MRIWVSSLALVHDAAARCRPSRGVSLLSPGDAFPIIDGLEETHHHRLHLHDIRAPEDDRVTPSSAHVEGLVAFLDGWRPEESLLIHCWAGISRSTATAFVAACLHNPRADEEEIAAALRAASPSAWPNTLMVSHADDILGRGGRMRAAVEAMGPGEFSALTPDSTIAAPFSIGAQFR